MYRVRWFSLTENMWIVSTRPMVSAAHLFAHLQQSNKAHSLQMWAL